MKVYIADDQNLFRKGMSSLVSSFKGVTEVKEAENGKEVIRLVKQSAPHVILMDYRMPVMDGAACSEYIIAHFPQVKIIMLSMNDEQHFVYQMMELGVHGYLLKNAEPEEVEEAIQAVVEKDFYYNHLVMSATRNALKHRKYLEEKKTLPKIALTQREKEVLLLICKELTAKEIADRLFISERTVNHHRANLMEKIGARNTVGLVKYAIENHFPF